VRTSKAKVFDITLAYPFERKTDIEGQPFREAKVNLKHYAGDLDRMLSLVEMMQTDLFQNALIPIHWRTGTPRSRIRPPGGHWTPSSGKLLASNSTREPPAPGVPCS
jgi:hypothetical protein